MLRNHSFSAAKWMLLHINCNRPRFKLLCAITSPHSDYDGDTEPHDDRCSLKQSTKLANYQSKPTICQSKPTVYQSKPTAYRVNSRFWVQQPFLHRC